jgi:hypothetical protein
MTTGEDASAFHEWVLWQWSPRRLVRGMMIPKRSHELDTKEFATLADSLKLWAMEEQGVHLPTSGDRGWDELLAMADSAE